VSSPSIIPDGSQVKLSVVRGQRVGAAYPVKEGKTVLGRAAAGEQLPVDVDMDDQERPGQIFAANQHAVLTLEKNNLTVEDSGTANGTYVNRVKLPPNSPQPLKPDDVVQIGTVQLQVKVKEKKRTGTQK
jgi:predicted component of type VI protein secretion system